jgi:2,5-diamino-6-(ribosylamino)-4(3H)-pyrimidinone 5'-phosphate reductase
VFHAVSLQPGAQTVLSGAETKAMTHYLRSRHDGILVGYGTAKADNPGLNTRYSEDGVNIVGYQRQPRPFILDPSARWGLDDTPKLFSLAESRQGKPPSWIVVFETETETESGRNGEIINKLKAAHGLVFNAGAYQGREEGVDWDCILRGMAKKGVKSVMIEGGGVVIKDLLRKRNQKYISSVIVTIAPTYLGAGGVDVAPRRSVETENEVTLGDIKWVPLGQDVVMAGFIK